MGEVAEIHKSEVIYSNILSSLHLAVFFDLLHLSSKIIMKCFVILAVIGMCHSLPQYYLADTAEVQEAKRQFAAAYNEAVRRGGSPAPVPVAVQDPSNYSPVAEPYVHVEIPAEPYVHDATGDDDAVAVVPALPAAPAAPVAPVAPVAPAYAPVQPVAPAYNPASYNFAAAPANYNFAAAPANYNFAAAPANYNLAAAPANYNLGFPGYAGWAGYQPYQQLQAAAPVAPVAPAAPAAHVPGTCLNWKGEGVPCL